MLFNKKNTRLVLNATPLVKGGALQACVSFIRQAIHVKEQVKWSFLISQEIADELMLFGVAVEQLGMYVVSPSPAKNKSSRKKILRIVNEINPSAIFTFFGPAYVDFDYPHLMGVADGWITHSTSLALRKKGGAIALLRLLFLFIYKIYWYKKATHWVVEAECAKRGMLKRFGIEPGRISIVPNSCSDQYSLNRTSTPTKTTSNNILVLSAYYIHKNLEIIPRVAFELKRLRGCNDFVFTITIQKGSIEEAKILSAAREYGVDEQINNIGPVAVKDGPDLYSKAVLTFMPTLLETFSAVYPESMMSSKPIVTSDLEFAHDICGEAALYFKPIDPLDAAGKIDAILNNDALYNELVQKGYSVVNKLPNQEEKYRQYEKIINNILV